MSVSLNPLSLILLGLSIRSLMRAVPALFDTHVTTNSPSPTTTCILEANTQHSLPLNFETFDNLNYNHCNYLGPFPTRNTFVKGVIVVYFIGTSLFTHTHFSYNRYRVSDEGLLTIGMILVDNCHPSSLLSGSVIPEARGWGTGVYN